MHACPLLATSVAPRDLPLVMALRLHIVVEQHSPTGCCPASSVALRSKCRRIGRKQAQFSDDCGGAGGGAGRTHRPPNRHSLPGRASTTAATDVQSASRKHARTGMCQPSCWLFRSRLHLPALEGGGDGEQAVGVALVRLVGGLQGNGIEGWESKLRRRHVAVVTNGNVALISLVGGLQRAGIGGSRGRESAAVEDGHRRQ